MFETHILLEFFLQMISDPGDLKERKMFKVLEIFRDGNLVFRKFN